MDDAKFDQLSDILEELAALLDVTDTEFNTITRSYEAVGKFLADDYGTLAPYKPSIHPQGSFLLGTVVRPIDENQDIDIDLVCELQNKPSHWTQYHLKNAVGDRLKSSDRYKRLLDREGKRCWTLLYGDNKYHLDVLPSLVCENYREIVTKYFTEGVKRDPDTLAIHITDKTRDDYKTESNSDKWMISNPFGYAQWFLAIAQSARDGKGLLITEAKIDPVPKFSKNKYVLQRVVQLMKRHRDKMFGDDDCKPISIIITTLAARAYNQEKNLAKALLHVANTMSLKIEDRAGVKWVVNPVNKTENFADKWPSDSHLQQNFQRWINRLKYDVERLLSAEGLPAILLILNEMFDEKVARKTYDNYGNLVLERRKSGNLKSSAVSATLGLTGAVKVAAHNFYGTETEEK